MKFVITMILAICLFASVFGQMFQYSRGWRNGKRSGEVMKESSCQLLLRSLLDNKPVSQINSLCDWCYEQKQTLLPLRQEVAGTDLQDK
ncbi:pro-corazonin-like [Cimex lectularius]|uniref:Pro-corazonin n=1 Tax=Cimex lectularius TaxID=79782 RepID=A0A8I6RBE7_CIMLE|nr:pro-corazonin-like [Cimex lectularius]